MTEGFFTEQAEQSQVKSKIVAKYFAQWSKIIIGHLRSAKGSTKIAYIDLFAGPGRYEDGAKSTPIMIIEEAIKNPLLRDNLVTLFNDRQPKNTSSLEEEIGKLPGIETLKYKPQIHTEEVGERIVKQFEKMSLIPTLFFIDPWGYKALSLRLINSVLKDWACECIFFFNYGRINAGLSNVSVRVHMEALFGKERAEELSVRLEPMEPHERELTIVEELCTALIEMGGTYTLPFGFKNSKGTRTKHHLIFVSKHKLGYKIMKSVMAGESSVSEQGVATFEFSPASEAQPLLFEMARPLDDLEDMLLDAYAGRTMKMVDIFESHNYGRKYAEKNYKDVLTKMEMAGKITADTPHNLRAKRNGLPTCADHVQFSFPKRK